MLCSRNRCQHRQRHRHGCAIGDAVLQFASITQSAYQLKQSTTCHYALCRVYELYSDFVMKNPFYEVEQVGWES